MRVFNVQFFGDGGSHSWLPAQRLFPYQGDIQQLYEMAVDGSLDKKARRQRRFVFLWLSLTRWF